MHGKYKKNPVPATATQPAKSGGGGARHISLESLGDTDSTEFARLLSSETFDAVAIGVGDVAEMTLKTWGGDARSMWRVSNQYDKRHPAWEAANGFPDYADHVLWKTAPTGTSRGDKDNWNDHVVVYWVLTNDGEVFVGYVLDTTRTLPAGWPDDLAPMFEQDDSQDGLTALIRPHMQTLSPLATSVLDVLAEHRNALLYGPPGTGKTRVMQQLAAVLEDPSQFKKIVLDPSNQTTPFQEVPLGALPIAGKVYVDWMTFHQRTTYEEFVVGLQPKPVAGGIELRPRAGRLLEAIYAIESGACDAAVLLIDEINRADAAAVLGELITFLEPDKRDLDFYPTYLNADPKAPGQTVMIDFRGGPERLPFPVKVPERLYVLGTMNALDRSIAPLDQALTRRFQRVEAVPDTALLRRELGATDEVPAHADLLDDGGAGQTAYHLLRRVNQFVRHTVGRDAQFGHGYLADVWKAADGQQRWDALSKAWDHAIFPQLEEFFRARTDTLTALVHGGDKKPFDWYPYALEAPPDELADDYVEGGLLVYGADAVSSLSAPHQREALAYLATGRAAAQTTAGEGDDED